MCPPGEKDCKTWCKGPCEKAHAGPLGKLQYILSHFSEYEDYIELAVAAFAVLYLLFILRISVGLSLLQSLAIVVALAAAAYVALEEYAP